MDIPIDRILAAWRLSPGIHELREPAGDELIAVAERRLGRAIPGALKTLYQFSDGIAALDGNLGIDPLLDREAGGLVDLGDRLHGANWPIPEEVFVFGGNGAGDLFGLWYPSSAAPDQPTAVVMIGSVFEPECLALVGTTLSRFLLAWSAYYLVLLEAPAEALDALAVPDALRVDPSTLSTWAPYFRWADPSLPDHDPDPYARGMDASTLADAIDQLHSP